MLKGHYDDILTLSRKDGDNGISPTTVPSAERPEIKERKFTKIDNLLTLEETTSKYWYVTLIKRAATITA